MPATLVVLERHLDPSPLEDLGQLHALRQRHHLVLVAVHDEERCSVLRTYPRTHFRQRRREWRDTVLG
jgi:hypothetical protein